MQRDISGLTAGPFDLVVVGGGVSGAICAWDAASRGLAVALVEKDDFGGATSSASSKVLHGGIRYLQRGNLLRVRESSRERAILARAAPHLVRTVPFLVPTYRSSLKGLALLTAGMTLYDLVTAEFRNAGVPGLAIPPFERLGRGQVTDLEPDLPADGLTGGVRYCDYHMHSSERMTLACIRSAAAAGARVANYVAAEGLLVESGRAVGVRARDRLGGGSFEVRARVVANLCGPWVRDLIGDTGGGPRRFGYAKGVHVVTRPLTRSGAVALTVSEPNEALVSRGGRHIFMIPWRGRSLIGTANLPFGGPPDALRVDRDDLKDFLGLVNSALPAAKLSLDDVAYAYGGIYTILEKPVREGAYQGGGPDAVYHHARRGGLHGLVSAVCNKYTLARRVAVACVDIAFRELGLRPPATQTDRTPVAGGDVGAPEAHRAALAARYGDRFPAPVLGEVAACYGSDADALLAAAAPADPDPVLLAHNLLPAQVTHAVRNEMACHLTDVVFRRTGLGTLGHPGSAALERCADLMAAELGWNAARRAEELASVAEAFGRNCPVSGAPGTGTAP